MAGSVTPRSQAAVHAHRPADQLPLVGRRAARRYERRQLRRPLDRVPFRAGHRHVPARRDRHECLRALPRRQAARATSTTSTSATTATTTVDLEAGKLYPIRLDFHEVRQRRRHATGLVARRPAIWNAGRLDAARQADAVVLVLGLSPRLEGEEMRVPVEGFQGGDRVDLGLPRAQEDLLQKVLALGSRWCWCCSTAAPWP